MKTLIAFLFVVICFLLLPPRMNRAALRTSDDYPCVAGSFTAVDADAPARLTVTNAQCNGPKWNATLLLANTGDKVITGYDISNVEAYDHKKNVKSSQGESGFTLKTGESKEILSNGGFRNGLSYGKPTGSIRKNVFRLTRLEFADGTVWRLKRTP
jgi:hypothetical protein